MNEDTQRQLEQLQQQGVRVAQRLQKLTASATDERSVVTVTCAPGGRLADIEFAPAARKLDTHELRDAVLAAATAATDAVQRELADVLRELTAESGVPGGDVVREVTKQMEEVRRVVAEQQRRIMQLQDSVPPAS
jgi:DNA-binding protein YbaB